MNNILITGATGFLGWNVAKRLLLNKNNKLYTLSRTKNNEKADHRIKSLFISDYGDLNNFKTQIEVIEGDITLPLLGIKKSAANDLYKKINDIYHCAALCDFGAPLEPIRNINVIGTKNVLDFAIRCKGHGQFNKLSHISTVGVAGDSAGRFYEGSLDVGQKFNNTYEQTKYEAEELVQHYRQKGLSISVFRPTIVSGDSRTGKVTNFQMFYQPLHIFSLELFSEIPANKVMKYNLVPVDYVADAICLISPKGNNRNYHLVNPSTVTLEYFLDVACKYFCFKKPHIIDRRKFDYSTLTGFRKKLLDPYIPYFNHKYIVYDDANFRSVIAGQKFMWPKIDKKLLLTLFKYCDKVGFIKRKRR